MCHKKGIKNKFEGVAKNYKKLSMVPIITWAPPHLSPQTEHSTITASVFEQT